MDLHVDIILSISWLIECSSKRFVWRCVSFIAAEIKAARVGRATGLQGGNVRCVANTGEVPVFRLRTSSERSVLEFLTREIKIGTLEKSQVWRRMRAMESVKMWGMYGCEEREREGKKEREEKIEKVEWRRGNNKMKKRGVMLSQRVEERQAWRAEKNLTGSSLVSFGSPNNSVRPLNKQQFRVIARHSLWNPLFENGRGNY